LAGKDVSRYAALADGPVVVLVEPQLGENIGMAARAMLNCGLTRLRLVRPRDPWPNAKAAAAASGAGPVLDRAETFATTAEAIADLQHVYAATARPRGMTKRMVAPREAAAEARALASDAAKVGFLFGKEAKGLHNNDVALADAVLLAPLNPTFSSLNLAMAVLLVGYEWWLAAAPAEPSRLAMPKETRPAEKRELLGLFQQLEAELDGCGFLRNHQKRPIMVRNLRNMLSRAGLTEQEVRTLRGVVACLVAGRRGPAL
jgi:tRNA/rRNA methyltransferase